MQIVIDIPKRIFDMTKEMGCIIDADNKVVADAIIDGTPLPKGHGRLIDADKLFSRYTGSKTRCPVTDTMMMYEIFDEIQNAPTIIEADKEE